MDPTADCDAQASTGPFPLEVRGAYNLKRQQILQALPRAPRLHWSGTVALGTIVVRVAAGIVVKFGANVQLSEAQTMRHVKSTTSVRLPHVYDYWQSLQRVSVMPGDEIETVVTYIVMSYIYGQTLDAALPKLKQAHWTSIHGQLIQMLEQLHRVQGTKPGPVGNGRSLSYLFTEYGAGPFTTKQDLVNWYDRRLEVCKRVCNVSDDVRSFGEDIEKLVLCHLDLHLRNIILDTRDYVWLIDWEWAGFYPSFLEYAAFNNRAGEYWGPLKARFGTPQNIRGANKFKYISWALTTGAFSVSEG